MLMPVDTRAYSEELGRLLFTDLAPITAAEMSILDDAVTSIHRQRMIDFGVAPEAVDELISVIQDYFGMVALVGGENA